MTIRPLSRRRAAVKFFAWLVVAVVLFGYAIRTYTSGKMVEWYYFRASARGYAVNTRAFERATPLQPARLTVGRFDTVDGSRAVPVAPGDRLPAGTTGVVDAATVREGRRARLEGGDLLILVPWEVRESKGFAFREGFAHKNVRANPVSGVWNLVMVILLGLSLGLMAEGFTDLIGVRLRPSDHSITR